MWTDETIFNNSFTLIPILVLSLGRRPFWPKTPYLMWSKLSNTTDIIYNVLLWFMNALSLSLFCTSSTRE